MSLIEIESQKSLIDIGYPLKLTDENIKHGDKLSISEGEMWALQNTRHVLRKNWRRYALELYIDFFTEHHEMINRFRDRKTGKLNPILMSEHGIAVFEIFQDIINRGLRNWPKSMHRIGDMSKCHVAHGVTLNEIQSMAKAIKDVIMRKCDGLTSPTVEIAFEKLCQEYFQQHIAREEAAGDDVWDNFEG